MIAVGRVVFLSIEAPAFRFSNVVHAKLEGKGRYANFRHAEVIGAVVIALFGVRFGPDRETGFLCKSLNDGA